MIVSKSIPILSPAQFQQTILGASLSLDEQGYHDAAAAFRKTHLKTLDGQIVDWPRLLRFVKWPQTIARYEMVLRRQARSLVRVAKKTSLNLPVSKTRR